MIKIFSLLSVLILINACFPVSIYKATYQAAKNQINSETFEITPPIRNLPFAMQIVEHQGSTNLMVLGYEDNDDKLSFIDATNNIFTVFHGKVISSNNYENNLTIHDPPNIKDIFLQLKTEKVMQIKHESLIRFTNPETPYLKLTTNYQILPQSKDFFKRKIDGIEIAYFILEERFKVPQIYWEGKNMYWFSEQGDILKSKQIIFPNKPKFFFETLKMFKG